MTIHDALEAKTVKVDAHCVGDRWVVHDSKQLAQLVAIVAMGQAVHAARIIQELEPATPAIKHSALLSEAKWQLQIVGTTAAQKDASRWRRDGFIFEVVSWIAARRANGKNVFLRDPHTRATTQGIDGLMLEMDPKGSGIARATIFEDKCTESPRDMFRGDVMTTFRDHHQNKRSAELVSTAATLIEKSGMIGTAAVQAAGRVLDKEYRRYRAAFAITGDGDTEIGRKALFKGFDGLDGIKPDQRLGATFVVEGKLREYFDGLAKEAIAALDSWTEDAA